MSPENPVRVVRGIPDDDEVAALAAVVTGIVAAQESSDQLAGMTDEEAPGVRSRWSDHTRLLGLPPRPGAGAWQWSAHP